MDWKEVEGPRQNNNNNRFISNESHSMANRILDIWTGPNDWKSASNVESLVWQICKREVSLWLLESIRICANYSLACVSISEWHQLLWTHFVWTMCIRFPIWFRIVAVTIRWHHSFEIHRIKTIDINYNLLKIYYCNETEVIEYEHWQPINDNENLITNENET